MSVETVSLRREAFKDFLTVMVALTEASGEIAKAFWEFLDYVPEERNFQLMSFDVKPDDEILDTALEFSSTPCKNASSSKSIKRGIRELGVASAPGKSSEEMTQSKASVEKEHTKSSGGIAPEKSGLPPRTPKPSM